MRGTSFFIRDTICFNKINISHISQASIELGGITVTCNPQNITIINLYRHPGQHTPRKLLHKIFSLQDKYKNLIVLGDFNAHHTLWNNHHTDRVGEDLLSASELTDMVLLNDDTPTRISTPHNNNSTIDLVFASRELASLCNVATLHDTCGSDHLPISIRVSTNSIPPNKFAYKIKLKKAQINSLRDRLREDSSGLEGSIPDDPIEAYSYFVENILEHMRAIAQSPHRPKSNRKNNNSKLNPAPWWNEECELAVKRRKEGLKIYRTAPTIENYRLYKKICRDCKKVLKTQKRNGWKRFCGEFNHKTPTPAIWRLIKLFKKKSQTFSPHDCETLTQMQLATIDKLCPPSCLHKINDNPSSSSPADSEQASTFQWLDNPFSLHELEHVLNSLKKTSAPGLDQIDNLVLSILPQSYRHIMLRILNNLFAYKLFPKPWLHSLIVLIPKPNGTGVRPISLLSSILKVTEKIIYNRLRWLAETQFIIPSTQFGFRSFRSCNDNLSILTNHIHLGFLKGEYTVCIFVDIAGAFDNIIPNTLIHDLDSLGIPDKTKNFIKNLICERKLNFIINGDIHGPYYTHKGTPQGSVLSPLLFNLYLKDVSKHLHTNSSSLQYADDLAIYSTHRSLEEALSSVWVSLKRVKKYLQLRGLEISPSKSQGVVFTRKRGFDSSGNHRN